MALRTILNQTLERRFYLIPSFSASQTAFTEPCNRSKRLAFSSSYPVLPYYSGVFGQEFKANLEH